MRQLARRFSAYERRPSRKDPERPRTELRLLPQPIHRYACESVGLLDGAIFAFVHGGTNAQIVMLIEARRGDDDSARWTVGFGRLSEGDNFVQLDGHQFWSEAAPPRPLPRDFPSNYISKTVP